MKKLLLPAALLMALILALAACTGHQSDETAAPTADATEPTTTPATDPVGESGWDGDAMTESATDRITDPVTDPITDPVTDPVTDPATDPETAPETEPETEDDNDTHNYTSNVTADGEGSFAASELAATFGYWDVLGEATSRIDGGLYVIEGYTQMFITANGKYAFSVDNLITSNKYGAAMFVRGVEEFSFGDTGYFGTDQNHLSAGCGGIYFGMESTGETNTLSIIFRSYNGTENRAIVSTYPIEVPSADITVADDGEKVYVLSAEKLVATIAISGTRDFKYEGVSAKACAETVVLTLAGEEPVTVENAVVAASHKSDAGFYSRAGIGVVGFTGTSFLPFRDVTIPDRFMGDEEPPVLATDKLEYAAGEDILVTAYGSGDQWVGLYCTEDSYGSGTPSIYWYYIAMEGYTSGDTVSIKTTHYNAERSAYADLPAGQYKIVLFADGGYTEVARVEITVQ